ncbi:MAG: tetratricopeptide repeat protein [Methanoregula sp.]|nr:tetratricopeptide repeat protein [Methanoregula sp.]
MKLSHILAGILVLVICVFIYDSAGALYSQSVDLANAGKYSAALKAADQALALNASSLNPIIQANRAGILVMLGRNEDAITAADAALGAQGNLTTTYSIAYFNKGNALRNLGRTDEAKAAYTKAAELDPTLVNPYKT